MFIKSLLATSLILMTYALQAGAYDSFAYTGKILPEPVLVKYLNKSVSLKNAALVFGSNVGDEQQKALFKILKQRINAFGGNLTQIKSGDSIKSCSAVIAIGSGALTKEFIPAGKIPQRPEGYALWNGIKAGIPIIAGDGFDKLGITWCASSLFQMIDRKDGAAVAYLVEISDYPKILNRGTCWWNASQYKLLPSLAFIFKMSNCMLFRIEKLSGEYSIVNLWRKDNNRKMLDALKFLGESFNQLGISWGGVSRELASGKPEEKANLASNEEFEQYYRFMRPILENGGNLSLWVDDTRFPRNPMEKKIFPSAADAEVQFITRFYERMQEEFPSSKLYFCPVYYWGPRYPAAYPEKREVYLSKIKRLNKNIIFTWNGPEVCSNIIRPEHSNWVLKAYDRKPVLLQFTGGAHIERYHFTTEPKAWDQLYYPDFFNKLSGSLFPTWSPTLLASWLCFTWNPDKYRAEPVMRQIVDKIFGLGAYNAISPIASELGAIDKWGLTVSPGTAKAKKEINAIAESLTAKTNAAVKKYPMLKVWGELTTYVKSFAKMAAKNNNATMSHDNGELDSLYQYANSETSFKKGSDILFTPYDFTGANPPCPYAFKCEKRLATWIRGRKTLISKGCVRFDMTNAMLSKNYNLIISGQDDDSVKKVHIKIVINDAVIFDGPCPLARFGWYRHSFPINAGILKEGGNSLSIECMDDSNNVSGPPYFMINYAVLKQQN